MSVLKSRIADLGPKSEFAVVALAAVGIFVFNSVRHVLFPTGEPAITTSHLQHLIVYEVVTFLALAWFLRQRNWTPARLGAIPSVSDLPLGIGLAIVSYIASFATQLLAALVVPNVMGSAQNASADAHRRAARPANGTGRLVREPDI